MTDYADLDEEPDRRHSRQRSPDEWLLRRSPRDGPNDDRARAANRETAVVSFSRDGDDYVVVGSKSGEPEDPAWFTNLLTNPIVRSQPDGLTFQQARRWRKGPTATPYGTGTWRNTHSSPNTPQRQTEIHLGRPGLKPLGSTTFPAGWGVGFAFRPVERPSGDRSST